MDAEMSWHFQYHAQGSNCLLLYTAVPMGSMTMAFVELNECTCNRIDFMARIAVIWNSSIELVLLCGALGQIFLIKILVS